MCSILGLSKDPKDTGNVIFPSVDTILPLKPHKGFVAVSRRFLLIFIWSNAFAKMISAELPLSMRTSWMRKPLTFPEITIASLCGYCLSRICDHLVLTWAPYTPIWFTLFSCSFFWFLDCLSSFDPPKMAKMWFEAGMMLLTVALSVVLSSTAWAASCWIFGGGGVGGGSWFTVWTYAELHWFCWGWMYCDGCENCCWSSTGCMDEVP